MADANSSPHLAEKTTALLTTEQPCDHKPPA
jgi:hypothetical protein